VRIRLEGTAEQVSTAADLLGQVLPTTDVSRPYPNRRGGGVRVYLTCDLPADLPAHLLAVADTLRAAALQSAGTAGVDMPAELVRLGDQIHTADGWQQVDGIEVDGWGRHGQPDAVRIGTIAHQYADDFQPFPLGHPVKVRHTPGGGGQ
jgi:hypothetical protein